MCCISEYTTMFLATFLLLPEFCSNHNRSDRPVYRPTGKYAKLGDLPYVVTLWKPEQGPQQSVYKYDNHKTVDTVSRRALPRGNQRRVRPRPVYIVFCVGVLISNNKVLSAAYCFIKAPDYCDKCCGRTQGVNSLTNTYAVGGFLDSRGYKPNEQSEYAQWRLLKSVIVPENYGYRNEFPIGDIAVVRTLTFSFTKLVKTIKIESTHKKYGSILCRVSGFDRSISKDIPGAPLVCTIDGTAILVGLACGVQKIPGTKGKTGTLFTRVSSYNQFIKGHSNVHILNVKYSCLCIFMTNYIRLQLL
ncbi:uncharacterized protein isoform X2 [Choristoneura fumiferana]|uniref:uncharacterized protein isoform X2 n=1 Tax=Choristoneura fumiferana TaxID=7141 RepID=UPI003D154B14